MISFEQQFPGSLPFEEPLLGFIRNILTAQCIVCKSDTFWLCYRYVNPIAICSWKCYEDSQVLANSSP